jgi:uncharacterized damage-inducible protein DinB
MALAPARVLRAVRKAPTIFNALLHDVDAARALAATDGADGWSVVEVICHLRDFEPIVAQRLDLFLTMPNPVYQTYDPKADEARRDYKAANLREEFAALVELRRQNVAKLTALTPEQWNIAGSNPDFGAITLIEMMAHVALHDSDHQEQIARCLGLSDSLVD